MTNGSNFQTSVPMLVSIWRSRVAASGATPHPPSPKDYGQFKSLLERFGQETAKVLAWAVDNWWSFSQAAVASAGLPSCPSEPHIGFLLTHQHVAANKMFQLGLLPGPRSCPDPVVSSRERSEQELPCSSPLQSSSESLENRSEPIVFESLWIALTTNTDNPYARTLSRKEVEQFSIQRSQFGDTLFDSAVRFVLSNWYSFTMRVKTDAGETNVPLDPSAPFLLKHMILAVELLREREAELKAKAVRKAEEAATEAEQRERSRQGALMEKEAKQRQRNEVYRPTPEEIARDLAELE